MGVTYDTNGEYTEYVETHETVKVSFGSFGEVSPWRLHLTGLLAVSRFM